MTTYAEEQSTFQLHFIASLARDGFGDAQIATIVRLNEEAQLRAVMEWVCAEPEEKRTKRKRK